MDSAEVLRSGLDVLANVVAVVPPGGWDAASPCEGWTARHVAGHLTTVLGSAASVARGEEFSWADAGDPATVAGTDPAATLRDAGRAAREAVDGADLSQVMTAPMGEMPIGQRLSFPAMDTHLHAWDLSRAFGRPLELDPDVITFARSSLEPVPEDMLRSPQTFGPALEPPVDATPTERLMAFLGRDPRR